MQPESGSPSRPLPRVGVVGLGYMGLASAASFAHYGASTVGFDVVPERRAAVRAGNAPFYEDGFEPLLRDVVGSGRLRVAETLEELANASDVILLCLPTPPRDNGRIDLRPMEKGAEALGRALRGVDGFRLVLVKSTVVPATSEDVVGPRLRKAARKGPETLAVGANPEFLAEGRMVEDALRPDRIVVGVPDERSAELVRALYAPFPAPLILTSPAAAELTKYASNTFLAMKVSFANELARLSEELRINVDDVARGIGLDGRIGEKFLRAGPGFGGSCFSKDVRALVRASKDRGVRLRLSEQVVPANDAHTEHAAQLVLSQLPADEPSPVVALLGLAFKEGTDDLRESRALPIALSLARSGARVRAHDPVAAEKFRGWLSEQSEEVRGRVLVLASAAEAVQGADVAALQVPWPEYLDWPAAWSSAMRRPVLVDLRRAFSEARAVERGLRLVRLGDGRGRVRAPARSRSRRSAAAAMVGAPSVVSSEGSG